MVISRTASNIISNVSIQFQEAHEAGCAGQAGRTGKPESNTSRSSNRVGHEIAWGFFAKERLRMTGASVWWSGNIAMALVDFKNTDFFMGARFKQRSLSS